MIFLFVFKKMPNNVVTSHSLIVRTALVNDPSEIFVCLQKDAKQCSTVVTSHSLIVRTALVNDPNDIFVCLQKDAKQCCDATQQDCTYYTGPLP